MSKQRIRDQILDLCRDCASKTKNNIGSIKKALVSFMDSFISLYVIQAFHLCKNAFLQYFSGETT